jgi:hypothetical protein
MTNKLSDKDIVWLVEYYAKYKDYGNVTPYIGAHCTAWGLLTGKTVEIPGCTCEYSAYAKVAGSVFEQHKTAIFKQYEEIKQYEQTKEGVQITGSTIETTGELQSDKEGMGETTLTQPAKRGRGRKANQ